MSIATHISTFTEHDPEKSVTIDPMHTHCTWYEFYQIRIKRNKRDDFNYKIVVNRKTSYTHIL